MLKFGYITEVNADKGTVRVNFTDDGIVSSPLPVSVPASKKDKYSFPFQINEQVWCLMDDNCEYGVVGGAIYSKKDSPPAGAGQESIDIEIAGNKLKIKVDRNTGELEITSQKGVVVKALMEATIQAPIVQVNGNLTVSGMVSAASFGGSGGTPLSAPAGVISSGDIVAGAVSLQGHKHLSSAPGSPTSPPVP